MDEFKDFTKEKVIEHLGSMPLLNRLTEDQKKVIAGYMNYIELAEGDVVFLEGEPGDYVCFVAEGALEVSKNSREGRKVIAILQDGNSIGEMALVDKKPRSANVITVTNTSLITLSTANFEKMLIEEQQIGILVLMAIIRVLSMNLRDTSNNLTEHMLPVF